MKKPVRVIITSALFVLFSISCNKDETGIDADDVTQCPKSFDCTYRYKENIDIDTNFFIVPGNKRLFEARREDRRGAFPVVSQLLRIFTPADALFFNFSDSGIRNNVEHFYICLSCDQIFTEAIGGYAKGEKLKEFKDKWLIEANIIIGDINQKPVDTFYVKRIFSLEETE